MAWILADDNDGSRHQRLIAFNGVYEWGSTGGVIHWTHHDPDSRHAAGWLRHRGQTYRDGGGEAGGPRE